ncbi:RNA polymerase sigma factor (sigma-70 family) [Haloactinopolyspora alba]|uniref:RNA polymerase sigma factor (Sigma-70 family) n=1 Tax=Haloactinopolyspora alba TaxID=648780 RepID=A0A2P8EAY7_9ACTN|nr:sigma-70 family RNA polymerase sigma factor [Haloactinopolyspora alba]PSL06636.1 RNA polymerase sigma factor (sigma-70 family) [Haloactinopolyspora alba]
MTIPADAASDEQLIARTRSGDMAAYDELYRRHSDDAAKVARIVTNNSDEAQDIVAEAFTRVLTRLREGGGPDGELTPYLRTVVRRLAIDRHRSSQREGSPSDPTALEVLPRTDDPMARATDKQLVRHAFETLPERWQQVLWHTEIEGRSAASLAPALGSSPNAVAALAYRAREGLRQAYLAVNLSAEVQPECRPYAPKVAPYVRGTLSAHDTREVSAHLAQCGSCRERRDELLLLVSDMRGVLWPALLLPASAATAAAAGAAGAAGGGILAFLSPASWGKQAKQLAATSAGVAAAGVIAASAVLLAGNDDPSEPPRAAPTASSEPDAPADADPQDPPAPDPEPDEPAGDQSAPDEPAGQDPAREPDDPPDDPPDVPESDPVASDPPEVDPSQPSDPPTVDEPDEPDEPTPPDTPDEPTTSPTPDPPTAEEPPRIEVAPPATTVVVAGGSVELTVEVSGTPRPQLQWQSAEPPTDEASGATAQAAGSDSTGGDVIVGPPASAFTATAVSAAPVSWLPTTAPSWRPTSPVDPPLSPLDLPPSGTSSPSVGITPSPTGTPSPPDTPSPSTSPTETPSPTATATSPEPSPTPTTSVTQPPTPGTPESSPPPDPGEQEWVDIKGATSDTLVIDELRAEHDGRAYRLLARNPAGTVASEPAVLTVKYRPDVTASPQDVQVPEGDTATFEASAVGNPEQMSVAWQVREPGGSWSEASSAGVESRSGGAESGTGEAESDSGGAEQSTSTTLEISDVSRDLDGNEYRAVFTNDLGSSHSDPATLTVHWAPEIQTPPADVEAYDGDDATFSATATAKPAASWYWESRAPDSGTWTRIEGAGGGPGAEASLTLSDVTVDDDGTQYRAVFTNDQGTVESEAATLTVRPPTGSIRFTQPDGTTLCVTQQGHQATLEECVGTQLWERPGDGTIRSVETGECLDALGGPIFVTVRPCDDAGSQQWDLDTRTQDLQQIKLKPWQDLVDVCLDTRDVGTPGHSRLSIWSCYEQNEDGYESQLFRFVRATSDD